MRRGLDDLVNDSCELVFLQGERCGERDLGRDGRYVDHIEFI